MKIVVGVKFRSSNKVYFFDPIEIAFNVGEGVIVETARGQEYGIIATSNHEVEDREVVGQLKPVIRKATQKDESIHNENLSKRSWALSVCEEKIKKHNLSMKLVDAEYTFDRSKLIFSFTANGRIDFRELVRDLASVLRIRIDLRQIYERDDIKLRGALAPCGRVCCCNSFLPDFEKVSIKMAKNQSLSLNPQKISGVCGKLMCCLKYENEYYVEVNKKMPKLGARVITPDGEGYVEAESLLKCKLHVKVQIEDGSYTIKEYDLEDIKPITLGSLADDVVLSKEEEAELRGLED